MSAQITTPNNYKTKNGKKFPPHLIYKSKQSDNDIYFEKYRKKSGKERKKMNKYPLWDKQIKMINKIDRQRQIFCGTEEYKHLNKSK